MKDKPILHLNLTSKWYDMIEYEDKREEYRDIKPFYNRILDEFGYVTIKGKRYHCAEIIVCFSNGYAKDRRQMFWTIKHLEIAKGNPKWGALENKEYYVLHLDKNVTEKAELNI